MKEIKKNTFKNKESDEIRIQGFKKEFRLKLASVINSFIAPDENSISSLQNNEQPNPQENVLRFGQVVGICRQMGFIQEKRTEE